MVQAEGSFVTPGGSVGGLRVWNEQFRGSEIPGSTRVPTAEIFEFFRGKTEGLRGLDLGSGNGRSTSVLKADLKGSDIVALDLSFEGLSLTKTESRVQAKAEELPFTPGSFDFVCMCGVMTNIVDRDPTESLKLRAKVMSAVNSVIKPGGLAVISDFSADHTFDDYHVNYKRHALITGEVGTIAVLKNGLTFKGKSDQEVAAIKGTNDIERFAHHYQPSELTGLIEGAGLKVVKYTMEVAHTPKGGRPIENIIMVAEKI